MFHIWVICKLDKGHFFIRCGQRNSSMVVDTRVHHSLWTRSLLIRFLLAIMVFTIELLSATSSSDYSWSLASRSLSTSLQRLGKFYCYKHRHLRRKQKLVLRREILHTHTFKNLEQWKNKIMKDLSKFYHRIDKIKRRIWRGRRI